MLNKTVMILECSRIFSLPMTIFSWLVVFVFGVIDSGNIFYGLIALLGLCFAHLGTNLIDDFFDYKFLIKQVDFDNKKSILFVIGPEGGIDSNEREYLIQNGFICVSVGKNILRTETASLAFLAMINYEFMKGR